MLRRPEEEKKKWLEGVAKEFKDFEVRGVWVRKCLNEIPKGRRLIGSKWAFKLKRNGIHRSRLVALGYNQVPGVDYMDNFSGVVHDVTLRIALAVWLVLRLDVDQIDVETAFLEGELKENEYVYMSRPDGMDLRDDECLEIRKGMYGLVQAARIYWMKMYQYLTSENVGMTKNEVGVVARGREHTAVGEGRDVRGLVD